MHSKTRFPNRQGFEGTVQIRKPWDACKTHAKPGKQDIAYIFPKDIKSCSHFSAFLSHFSSLVLKVFFEMWMKKLLLKYQNSA